MHTSLFVWLFAASAGHARRTTISSGSSLAERQDSHIFIEPRQLHSRHHVRASDTLHSLAALLTFANPAAGFQITGRSAPNPQRLQRTTTPLPPSRGGTPIRDRTRLRSGIPMMQDPVPSMDSSSDLGMSRTVRSAMKVFADLRLAIAELFIIGFLCAIGTLIDQGQSVAFYESNLPSWSLFFGLLPEETKTAIATFLDANLPSPGAVCILLGFDNMFRCPTFLVCSAGLATSLATCSFLRQIPMAKMSQRWSFVGNPKRFANLDSAARIPRDDATDTQSNRAALALAHRGYHVFKSGAEDGGAQGYAFKGLFGRLAPIGVHISLLLIILGSTYSAFGTWKGDAFIYSGTSQPVAEVVLPKSPIATGFEGLKGSLRVDDFRIAYKPDGKVDQFYADIALDKPGQPNKPATTIQMNKPLRQDGLTVYQASWKVAEVRVKGRQLEPAPAPGADTAAPAPSSKPFREFKLQTTELEREEGAYATFLPLPRKEGMSNDINQVYGATLVARDLRQVVFFNPDGTFAGVRKADSGTPIVIDGVELIVEEIKGATGLSFKRDPGVPLVYLGFGGTMATTFASYLSHNQMWFLQRAGELYLGGKANRAKREVDEEVKEILDEAKKLEPAST